MRVYSTMPSSEFIAQLREIMIAAKVPSMAIHKLYELEGTDALEEEIAQVNEKLDDMTDERDQYRYALRALIERTEELYPDHKHPDAKDWGEALTAARAVAYD